MIRTEFAVFIAIVALLLVMLAVSGCGHEHPAICRAQIDIGTGVVVYDTSAGASCDVFVCTPGDGLFHLALSNGGYERVRIAVPTTETFAVDRGHGFFESESGVTYGDGGWIRGIESDRWEVWFAGGSFAGVIEGEFPMRRTWP